MSQVATKPEATTPTGVQTEGSWIQDWKPEDEQFWASGGSSTAWKTLSVTTASLMMAFASWFVVSALVTKLNLVGFGISEGHLYWLAAMPGLSAGFLRIIHTFLTPKFGTRAVVSLSTASLLIPLVGWYFAIQNPDTPYGMLLLLAFLAGLGGGNFSSFMPSTSLFFPKRLQGTALGIQAGIGNFGVSVVQFLTPWVIGFAMVGAAAKTSPPPGIKAPPELWLQNALFIWILPVALMAVLSWVFLRSVPVRANIREQMDIFGDKHTWIMTSLYVMTFGSFSGFAGTFGLMIKGEYGGFGVDPLKYLFIGALVGATIRVIGGPISDKTGGAPITTISALGLIVSSLVVTMYLDPTSKDDFHGFLYSMIAVFFFAGLGNASTFKQIPMIFDPRKAGGVIGWTAAIAAFGPFLFGVAIGNVNEATGSMKGFFYFMAAFYAFNLVLNWWFYGRKGAEKRC